MICRMLLRVGFCLSISAYGCGGSAAADLSFLPAPEAATATIEQHPIVLGAGAELGVATAEARRLRVGPHEPLLSGALGRRSVNNVGEFTVWDLQLSRAIRLGDKAALDRQSGDIGIQYAENAIDDAKHETALLLLNNWMDWVENEARANLDEAEAESYLRERDGMVRRLAQRDAAQRELDLAEAAYARARAAALASRGAAAEARSGLQRTFPDLFLPAAAPPVIAPELPPLPAGGWPALILQRSHEVRMAELEAARQKTLAARVASDRTPDPTLGVRAYSEEAGAETALALTLSVPLGFAGRSAAADAQSARADAAVAQLARVRREFERRAQSDVLRANTSFAAWQETAKAHAAAVVARERTQRGYEAGEFDLSELLFIARQTFDAARTELAARAAAQRAILQLQIDAHELWVLHDEAD